MLFFSIHELPPFRIAVSAVFRSIVLSRNEIGWLDDGSVLRDMYLKKDGPRVLVEKHGREMVIDTYGEAKRGRLVVDLLGLVQTIPKRWLCLLVVTPFKRSASFADSLWLANTYTHTNACVISRICRVQVHIYQTRAWDLIVNCTVTRPLPSSFAYKFVRRRWRAESEFVVCVGRLWFRYVRYSMDIDTFSFDYIYVDNSKK